MLKNSLLKKNTILPIVVATIITSIGVGTLSYANATHADTSTVSKTQDHVGRGPGERKGVGVMGTVTAINGNTITVADAGRPRSITTSTTTYTVDASSAKLFKLPETAPVAGAPRVVPTTITTSQIAIGDTVRVEGTISGTSVTATVVMDGKMGGRKSFGPGMKGEGVMGTIDAISGSFLTVTEPAHPTKEGGTTSTTTYTVDASSAKIEKDRTTITVTGLTVGDRVMVRGTVSGTSVVASDIIDGMGFGGGRGGPHKNGQAPLPTTTPQS